MKLTRVGVDTRVGVKSASTVRTVLYPIAAIRWLDAKRTFMGRVPGSRTFWRPLFGVPCWRTPAEGARCPTTNT